MTGPFVHVVFNRADANGGGCALVSCPGARLQLALIGDNEASAAAPGEVTAKDSSYELVAVEFEGNVAVAVAVESETDARMRR